MRLILIDSRKPFKKQDVRVSAIGVEDDIDLLAALCGACGVSESVVAPAISLARQSGFSLKRDDGLMASLGEIRDPIYVTGVFDKKLYSMAPLQSLINHLKAALPIGSRVIMVDLPIALGLTKDSGGLSHLISLISDGVLLLSKTVRVPLYIALPTPTTETDLPGVVAALSGMDTDPQGMIRGIDWRLTPVEDGMVAVVGKTRLPTENGGVIESLYNICYSEITAQEEDVMGFLELISLTPTMHALLTMTGRHFSAINPELRKFAERYAYLEASCTSVVMLNKLVDDKANALGVQMARKNRPGVLIFTHPSAAEHPLSGEALNEVMANVLMSMQSSSMLMAIIELSRSNYDAANKYINNINALRSDRVSFLFDKIDCV